MAKIELTTRMIIGDKLLASITDEGLVAIAIDKQTLGMVIEVFEKARQTKNVTLFLHDLKQLRVAAFERQ